MLTTILEYLGVFYIPILIIVFSFILFSKIFVKVLSYVLPHKFFLTLISPFIILHEICHLVVAILFTFRVTGVKLLTFKSEEEMGSIEIQEAIFTNPVRRLYQKIGFVFTGIAPIFVPMVVILILLSLSQSSMISEIFNNNFQLDTIIPFFKANSNLILTQDFLLFILLSPLLFLGCFQLSDRDLYSTLNGIITLTVIIILIAGISYGLGFQELILNYMIQFQFIMLIFAFKFIISSFIIFSGGIILTFIILKLISIS